MGHLEPVRTDSKGRFEFLRDGEGQVVLVRIEGGEIWAEAASPMVPAGTEELVLVLERPGALRYRLNVKPEDKGRALYVHLWRDKELFDRRGGHEPDRFSDALSPGVSEAVLFDDGIVNDLIPGTYTFRVSDSEKVRHTISMVSDIQVMAGGITADPRLLPIEVRSEQRTLTFEVLDPKGKPSNLILAAAYVHEDLAGACWKALAPSGPGRFTLTCAKGRVDFLAGGLSHCVQLVEDAPATNSITLSNPQEIELSLGPSQSALLEGTSFRARLKPLLETRGLPGPIEPHGEKFIELSPKGPHVLRTRFEGEHQLEIIVALTGKRPTRERYARRLDFPGGQGRVQIAIGSRSKLRVDIDQDQVEKLGRLLLDTLTDSDK